MSSSEWRKGKIGDVVEIMTGYPFQSKFFNVEGKGVKLVRGKNVTKGSLRWGDDTRYWEEVTESLTKYMLNENDVVIGMDGSLVGKNFAKINRKDLPLLLVQRVAALRAKLETEQKFVYYWINNEKFINYVDAIKTGTSIPHISGKQIADYEVMIPPLEEQKAIANILSSLDEKIELNNQMNKTLEEMAQGLFKRWFVDFEFPNEEGEPYKSSGGEMVDSELGMIPKGWKINSFGEIVENFDSKRIPLSSREREKREKIYPYYGAASITDYVDKYIFDGNFVLMGEDGTVIDEKGFPILQYVWGKFWVNNHAHVLKGKQNVSNEFVYLYLKNTNVAHIVTGAVQPKINQKNMNSMQAVLPNNVLLDKFNKIVKSIFTQKKMIIEENHSLKEIRDTLLPKLMSGEIRVNNLSINDLAI